MPFTGFVNLKGRARVVSRDLLFQQANGSLAVWYMDGGNMTQPGLLQPSHPGDADWRAVGTADLDGDGTVNLLFQHKRTGEVAVWFMNGVTLTRPALLDPSHLSGSWAIRRAK